MDERPVSAGGVAVPILLLRVRLPVGAGVGRLLPMRRSALPVSDVTAVGGD